MSRLGGASTPGGLLREARRRAGLTQAALAHRAGVTQSVVSAYESGARQPSLPTLQRLVSATGLDLAISLRRRDEARRRLTGPLGRRLLAHRRAVKQTAATLGATNLRVFGSVARGTETDRSDIDLLVDLAPDTGLLGLARLKRELSALLQARVDVVPAGDLKPDVARDTLAEAVPL